jgi:hypothetical protein
MAATGGDANGYVQYKAVYDFETQNPDELSFRAGDVIMVSKAAAAILKCF